MSPSSSSPPSPSTITLPTFNHILTLYPRIQRAVYTTKLKADPHKLITAQSTHDWRYDDLPRRLLAEQRNASTTTTSSSSSSPSARAAAQLSKADLQRLTAFKIVHGQHRPFLPGMVAKNDAKTVEAITGEAFALLSAAAAAASEEGARRRHVEPVESKEGKKGKGKEEVGELPEKVEQALRTAARLHGVGPATATLICSCFDPDGVVFFQDETVAWLCPELGEGNGRKLKYSWGEYKVLVREVGKLRERLAEEVEGEGGNLKGGDGVKAVDVEKVAFVVGHWELLGERERVEVLGTMERESGDVKGEASAGGAGKEQRASATAGPSPESAGEEEVKASRARKSKASTTKRKVKAREEITTAQEETTPLTKRRRK